MQASPGGQVHYLYWEEYVIKKRVRHLVEGKRTAVLMGAGTSYLLFLYIAMTNVHVITM